MRELTNSQKFLVFWLILIAGLVIGSKISLPISLLVWLTALWWLIFLSGQEGQIELWALGLSAGLFGVLIWQLTGGEAWLKIPGIDTISQVLFSWRDRVIDQFFLALPEPHGSLLAGILFGNRVKLDRDLIKIFQTVGLSHIIAVSGYNLSILTANIQSLLRPVIGRKSLLVAAVVIVAFILLSGAPTSILRAGVMSAAILIAQAIGRPSRSINILVLAAGLLAVFQPKIIFDIGFELSLAATYGLIRLGPVIEFALRFSRLPKPVIAVVSETLAATLLTTPIIIAYFERLSIISPIANLLVVPLLPLVMGLGLVAAVVIFIWPLAGRLLALLTWPILQWIIGLSTVISRQSFASTNVVLPIWGIITLIAVMVIGLELVNLRFGQLASTEIALIDE
jgi:ComEC/Rec2-related protein